MILETMALSPIIPTLTERMVRNILNDPEFCQYRDRGSIQIHYLWNQESGSDHYTIIYLMNYTIKIDQKEKEAGKIIQLIKEMVGDSPYVGIYEDETGLSDEMEQELDMRYHEVLKNPQEGNSWEEVKKDLLRR